MVFIKVNVFVVALFFAVTCSVNAQILSGSFEGDPNMLWAPNGPWGRTGQTPEILQTFTAHDKDGNAVTIEAIDGNSFVMLKTGGGTEGTDYSQLTQVIEVNVGESIAGVFFFATIDWMPQWNDAAAIYLRSPEPNSITGLYDIEILLAYKDVNSVVYYGGRAGGCMKDWGRFIHTFDSNEAGTYTLVLRVVDAIDNAYSSCLAVDALQILTSPPLPGCTSIPVGDLNRDCKVDLFDFTMMADNWLIDCNAEPNSPPCI